MKQIQKKNQVQLIKLKNQIRVQLNKIRPYHQQVILERKDKSSKKIFHQKYEHTSISELPQQRSQKELTPSKKYAKQKELVYSDQNKTRQRRHYDHSYSDKVDISIPLKRKTSNYFNVKPSPQKVEQHHTSLYGIGAHDKSLTVRDKSGKRVNIAKPTLTVK